MELEISKISGELPKGIESLRDAARAEGILLVDRLIGEWDARAQRFDADSECLMAARIGAALAGIGGLTRDPDDSGALRMRRFYVLPEYRRRGIGRALVSALLAEVIPDRSIGVHVGPPGAFPFWQAVGFAPVAGKAITHEYRAPSARR